ncbi:MAG: hypothetical protein LBG80_16880 [Bacteroidales bacterium]|nr:hypothetical protein [Bacteroidales bacterium]
MSERRAKMKAEKSRRDDTLLTVCFSLRGINDVFDYVIAKGDGARTVSTTANNQRNHSSDIQFIIHNYKAKAELSRKSATKE